MTSTPQTAGPPELTPLELAAVTAVLNLLNARSPDAPVWFTAHLSWADRPVVTVASAAGEREYRHPLDEADDAGSPAVLVPAATPHPGA